MPVSYTHLDVYKRQEQWLTQGVPDDPIAWLAQAARGYVTRDRSGRSPRSLPWPATADDLDEVRLIFLSSHPDVSPYMRAALTLRLVCGVPVADIAALFGVCLLYTSRCV